MIVRESNRLSARSPSSLAESLPRRPKYARERLGDRERCSLVAQAAGRLGPARLKDRPSLWKPSAAAQRPTLCLFFLRRNYIQFIYISFSKKKRSNVALRPHGRQGCFDGRFQWGWS